MQGRREEGEIGRVCPKTICSKGIKASTLQKSIILQKLASNIFPETTVVCKVASGRGKGKGGRNDIHSLKPKKPI